MLRFKLLLKVKPVFEQVANSNFLTRFRFFVRNHNIADFTITVNTKFGNIHEMSKMDN